MKKPKKKLTREQKAAKKKRREEYQIVFINGKQKRIKREPPLEELSDEYLLANASPIWLHQNGRWDLLDKIYNPDPADEDADDSSFIEF